MCVRAHVRLTMHPEEGQAHLPWSLKGGWQLEGWGQFVPVPAGSHLPDPGGSFLLSPVGVLICAEALDSDSETRLLPALAFQDRLCSRPRQVSLEGGRVTERWHLAPGPPHSTGR